MDISYFKKINNLHNSRSKQETDLYLLNRHVDEHFADTIDYHTVNKNGQPFELLIIKDTDGNTYKKKIKSRPSKPFNLGDYIEWNGQHWIVTLVDTDDKTYHSGYMYLCTILIRWQNAKGKIVERWGWSEDFTKYSTGRTGNSTITLGEYQYGITLPVDDETKVMKRDRRFPIDLEGVEPPDVYMLTNRKILLTDASSFDRGGILVWTLSFDTFNADTDKLVELPDGRKVWIADYHAPTLPSKPDESPILLTITHKGSNSIIAGGNAKTFSVLAIDSNGNKVSNEKIEWKVTCLPENEKFISYEILQGYSIKIKSLYDDSIIGTQFLLTATLRGNTTSIYIEIGGGI